MADVYKNSLLNISASVTASEGGSSFFVKRNPAQIHLYQPWSQLCLKMPPPVTYQMTPVDLWKRSVEEATINTRGWVLQERVLSPRVVHFCKDQIFWECRQSRACESMPAGILLPIEIASLNPVGSVVRRYLATLEQKENSTPDDEPVEIGYRYSQLLTHIYSTCHLTYKTDKLMAMSGIARELSPRLGLKYAAGHWLKHMPWSLLWQTKPHSEVTRIRDYVAPSWSCACIDGEIVYEDQKGIEKTAGLAVEINEPFVFEQMAYVHKISFSDYLDSLGQFPKPAPDPTCVLVFGVDVNLVNKDDAFGQITSGVLHVSGKVLSIRIALDESKEKISYITINDSVDLYPDPASKSPDINWTSFELADISHLDGDHSDKTKVSEEVQKMVQSLKAAFSIHTKQAELLLDDDNALTKGAMWPCDLEVGVISVIKDVFFLPLTQKTPDDPMIGLLLSPQSSGSFARLGIMKAEKKIAEMFSSISNREIHIV